MRARLVLALHAAAATACANRVAPPPRPYPSAVRQDLRDINVVVRSFSVDGRRGNESAEQMDRLEDRFLDYVEARSALTTIYLDRDATPPPPVLELDVHLSVKQTTYRTLVLDALALVPHVFGFLTPAWGHVAVVVDTRVTSGGEKVAALRHEARAPFSAVFFSWFRRTYVEAAYMAAYADCFDSIAVQLAALAPQLRAAALSQHGVPDRLLADHRPNEPSIAAALPPDVAAPSAAPPPAPLDAALTAPVLLTPDTGGSGAPADVTPLAWEPQRKRFGLITEAPSSGFDGTLYGALRLLGGIEVAGIGGVTAVSSGVQHESGGREEIASGDAERSGWRVALYSAPSSTGFFVYPTAGYMAQTVSIADFRDDLPRGVSQPQATEIEAICTDPGRSGEPTDCGSPNTYRLVMSSLYGGARAGYDLVAGNDDFQVYLSLGGGLNVVERRTTAARIAEYRARGTDWVWLDSFAAGGALGVLFPKLHWAVRVAADYELYRRFAFAEEIEFKGDQTWDSERRIYIRPRVFVKDARLSNWSFQFATAFVF